MKKTLFHLIIVFCYFFYGHVNADEIITDIKLGNTNNSCHSLSDNLGDLIDEAKNHCLIGIVDEQQETQENTNIDAQTKLIVPLQEKDFYHFEEFDRDFEDTETSLNVTNEEHPDKSPQLNETDSLIPSCIENNENSCGDVTDKQASLQNDNTLNYANTDSNSDEIFLVNLYQSACETNNYFACYRLAEAYHDGDVVTKNYHQAMVLYTKSCDNKHAASCNNVGYLYDMGLGIEKDYKKSAYYYHLACYLNDGTGCFNLANLYENGIGIKQNIEQALRYYKDSCIFGNKDGCDAYLNSINADDTLKQ